MLHRLRLAMASNCFDRLSGEAEADETYIGGKARRGKRACGPHRERRLPCKDGRKTVVMGVRERGGRVPSFLVPSSRKYALLPRLLQHVEPGSTL